MSNILPRTEYDYKTGSGYTGSEVNKVSGGVYGSQFGIIMLFSRSSWWCIWESVQY